MSETTPTTVAETSIFDTGYEREVYEDNFKTSAGKTFKSILIIAGVFLIGDLIAFAMIGVLNAQMVGFTMIIPAIITGIAFLAKKQPMVAMTIVTVLVVGIFALMVIQAGAMALVGGWLMKIILVTNIIWGFRNAKDAMTAKRNLEAIKY